MNIVQRVCGNAMYIENGVARHEAADIKHNNQTVKDVLDNLPCGCGKGRVGHFASPATVGNFSVIGLGFKPKVIEFVGSKNDGWQTWFFHSHGFADDTGNQNVLTLTGNYSNLFRGDCKFDCCIYLRNTAGNIQVMGSLVSMDDDGFTLNFTNVNSIFVIRWKAIG